jgi:hypothetical protein
MTWKKGESGNPAGRPKGSKDRRSQLREMLEDGGKEIVELCVQRAREGDSTALTVLMNKLIPNAKGYPVTLDTSSNSLAGYSRAVISEVAMGQMTPEDASRLLQGLGVAARIEEVEELRQRVEQLEARVTR